MSERISTLRKAFYPMLKRPRLRRYVFFFALAAAFSLTLAAIKAATSYTVFLPLVRSTGEAQATATQRWSDPASWPDGKIPQANQAVVIAPDKRILLDISPPPLASLLIHGALVFDERDLELNAGWIMLHGGTLAVGSEAKPFGHRATITLTAANPAENQMSMGTRGILVMQGSQLNLFGSAPAVVWTKLDAHAAAGATSLQLAERPSWRAGDQIVVAPSDFYGVAPTEQLEVTALVDRTVSLRDPLKAARWGKLQYISATGMTLVPDTTVSPLTLDERAEVGVLTRNVVVQGADDALWREQGFGAHIMGMVGSALHIDGVELRRVGQASKTGRYPIHFHGMSYTVDGQVLSDATGQFVRNSSVSNSRNRCIVLHATNGVTLQNNICYDIVGHAIFLEDAIERRNSIIGNLVLKVRNPPQGKELLKHEGDVFSGGSSGFWITHPDNVLRDNVAADTEGNGIWYALPKAPLGVFKRASIPAPVYTAFGSFANNSVHSNKTFGFQLDWAPINDAGEVSPISYRPTANGEDPNNVAFEASLPYTIGGLTSYKNLAGSLWHREGGGTFEHVVAADNPGRAFAGSANCVIQDSASIGDSLNNATPVMSASDGIPPSGMASYHSSCDIKRHVFVNLPFVEGKTSGVLDTSDLYIRPVERGLYRDTDLRFINAHFGYRTPPFVAEHWTLAGAVWDPYGYTGPQGNYWVFNDPFLTDGTACQDIAPAGKSGKSCQGPYYGLAGFVLDKGNEPWGALMPIEVTRDNGAVWSVGDGNTAPKLGNMRHAALVKDGSFVLRFPSSPNPRNVQFTLENMLTPDDAAILGVQFDGSATDLTVYGTTWSNAQDVLGWSDIATSKYVRLMQRAASVDEVRASNGDKYYQDSTNNLVYIKLRHALPLPSTPAAGSDDELYHAVGFVIAAN